MKTKLRKMSMYVAAALGTQLAFSVVANANPINRDINLLPTNQLDSVTLELDVADGRQVVNIGDEVAFCFRSNRDGYASLWDIGTSGEIKRLYPYPESSDTFRIVANDKKCVGNGRFVVAPPVGTENIVLYYTAEESAQLTQMAFANVTSFASGLQKNVIDTGYTGDWTTAVRPFVIKEPNANLQSTVSPTDVSQTIINQFDNVYVLAVGSNVGELKQTNADAILFSELAINSFDIDPSQVTLLENGTKAEIKAAFESLSRQAGANDLVLFYYSGHGSKIPDDNGDEQDNYDEALVPFDLETSDSEEFYIRDDELKIWLSDIKADTVITLYDACHSGGMFKGLSLGLPTNAVPKFYRSGLASEGATFVNKASSLNLRDIDISMDQPTNTKTKYVMISASKENQFAMEYPGRGGAFTLALHELIEDKSQNLNNWDELTELLIRSLDRASNRQQTPVKYDTDNALKELKFK